MEYTHKPSDPIMQVVMFPEKWRLVSKADHAGVTLWHYLYTRGDYYAAWMHLDEHGQRYWYREIDHAWLRVVGNIQTMLDAYNEAHELGLLA